MIDVLFMASGGLSGKLLCGLAAYGRRRGGLKFNQWRRTAQSFDLETLRLQARSLVSLCALTFVAHWHLGKRRLALQLIWQVFHVA